MSLNAIYDNEDRDWQTKLFIKRMFYVINIIGLQKKVWPWFVKSENTNSSSNASYLGLPVPQWAKVIVTVYRFWLLAAV